MRRRGCQTRRAIRDRTGPLAPTPRDQAEMRHESGAHARYACRRAVPNERVLVQRREPVDDKPAPRALQLTDGPRPWGSGLKLNSQHNV